MSIKYHINPNTGRIGQCRAKSAESCQFSRDLNTVVQHYDSREEAQQKYEEMNSSKTIEKPLKKNNSGFSVSEKNNAHKTRVKFQGEISDLQRNISALDRAIREIQDINKAQGTKFNVSELKSKSRDLKKQLPIKRNEYYKFMNDNDAVLDEFDKEKLRASRIRSEIAARRYSDLSCGGGVSATC